MIIMKDKNSFYFLLTFLTMLLAGFLLFKIYDFKKTQQNLQKEYDTYKAEQENKKEWSEARYWDFTFKYPKDWHISLFFTDDNRQTKTFAINPYPVDFTRMAFSKGFYELTIYEDPSLFDDEFWQKTQEEYLAELDFVEPEEIETPYGHIDYYKAKEKQDTAPGQNVEAYFYTLKHPAIEEGQEAKITYLKLELLYINDWQISEFMREIALSIKPL